MKLVVFALLLTTAAVCYADDTPSPVPSVYDRIIKEIYQQNQPMLELNGEQYQFGPFANEKPLLQAVAASPKAVELFQESSRSGRISFTLLTTTLGLGLVALGFEVNANSQPRGSMAATRSEWIALGFLVGSFVTSNFVPGYESDMLDKLFKGVNQYNRDLLDAHS